MRKDEKDRTDKKVKNSGTYNRSTFLVRSTNSFHRIGIETSY